MRIIFNLTAILTSLPFAVFSAQTTYVHPTNPACLGNSPCFTTMAQALDNVDSGGTVIVLADTSEVLNDTHGKRNITIKGEPNTVTVDANVNLADAVLHGWTIRDLNFTQPIVIGDITGSLTLVDLSASAIKIGEFTKNTDATIIVRGVTIVPGGSGSIWVEANPGFDIDGSITIEDNIDVKAININVHAADDPAFLAADIVVSGNDIDVGGGVRLLGERSAGSGQISGSISISGNTMSALDGKFGVIVHGNVIGDITGPVSFHDNDAAWLACLTTESIEGSIGRVTFTDNTVEALELVTNGRPLYGPVLVSGNQIFERDGPWALPTPIVLVNGFGIIGNVTVENNSGSEADYRVRSSDGVFEGEVKIIDNTALRLSLDSLGGPFLLPFTVTGNELPQTPDPFSKITIETQSQGDMPGGTITGNVCDWLRIIIGGSLTGPLNTSGNIAREQTTFLASGGQGAGLHTVTGNDFQGTSFYLDIDSLVRFNRHGGDVTVIAGTSADARYNWWGCNDGPGASGCSEPRTAGFSYTPWLTFNVHARCNIWPNFRIDFDLLTASDGSSPSGNVTPGTVTVSTPDGIVNTSPVPLVNGVGTTTIALFGDVHTVATTIALDFESAVSTRDCPTPDELFSDGLEIGDDSAWSITQLW